MASNTLDDMGRSVLETVAEGSDSLDALASAVDESRPAVESRLEQLLDNALVRETDGAYELTENGRRVLEATPAGARDDRIDTPVRVERALEDLALRADEERAVRSAFAYLRHWGEVTTAELLDGVYSEAPAGYDAPEVWWDRCVRERLEALPDVRFDPDESLTGRWRWAGEAVVETSEDEDGRAVEDSPSAPPAVGSVRHAVERAELTDRERALARTAFELLSERESATAATLVDRADEVLGTDPESPTGGAGGSDADEDRADRLSEILAEVPGIERVTDAADGPEWRYAGPDDASGGT